MVVLRKTPSRPAMTEMVLNDSTEIHCAFSSQDEDGRRSGHEDSRVA